MKKQAVQEKSIAEGLTKDCAAAEHALWEIQENLLANEDLSKEKRKEGITAKQAIQHFSDGQPALKSKIEQATIAANEVKVLFNAASAERMERDEAFQAQVQEEKLATEESEKLLGECQRVLRTEGIHILFTGDDSIGRLEKAIGRLEDRYKGML